MKKISTVVAIMVCFVLLLVSFAEARNSGRSFHNRGHGHGDAGAVIAGGLLFGLGVAVGTVISQPSYPPEGGTVYVGKYPKLAGGNVVSVLNGTAYDVDVTARGNVVRLGSGARADFPVFFDEQTVFTAVVLDNGWAIGTAEQSFYTNGRPGIWHITSFRCLHR